MHTRFDGISIRKGLNRLTGHPTDRFGGIFVWKALVTSREPNRSFRRNICSEGLSRLTWNPTDRFSGISVWKALVASQDTQLIVSVKYLFGTNYCRFTYFDIIVKR